jgi:hypothetical protein
LSSAKISEKRWQLQQKIGLRVPQLADDGAVERVQMRVESPEVKCCSTVVFGMCSYSEIVIVPVLKSVTRKRLAENIRD